MPAINLDFLAPNWQKITTTLFVYDKDPVMFNSALFLLLFAVFYTGYTFGYKHLLFRKLYLVVFSLFFYYRNSGVFVGLLAGTVVIDYYISLALVGGNATFRKALLTVSIMLNLGILGYFKYANFFIDTYNNLSDSNIALLKLFLPIGISFFTFQTISYKVDIYKGKIAPATTLLDYAFYMVFFPHLVAGPIVRAKDFLPQLNTNNLNKAFVANGVYLILKGLFKKVVVADYVAQYADIVYNNAAGYSGFEHLMAMYAYTLQIFCDFSGYTDMALGIAALLGYELLPNFNSPYKSLNLTDFWRRWHISLSSWLKDYVYIPLGGNRHGKFMQQVNQLLTMLIGGFWHGAAWRFILWGGMHGVGLVVHKTSKDIGLTKALGNSRVVQLLCWFLTFHTVAVLWVFFRVPTMEAGFYSLSKIVTDVGTFGQYALPFLETRWLVVLMMLCGYALTLLPDSYKQWFRQFYTTTNWGVKLVLMMIVIQLGMQLANEGVQPFIYFQF